MMAVRYHGCTCHLRYGHGGHLGFSSNGSSSSSFNGGGGSTYENDKYDAVAPIGGGHHRDHHRDHNNSGGGSANGHGGGHNSHNNNTNRNNNLVDPSIDPTAQLNASAAEAAEKAAEEAEETKPQPWYFHVVASLILVVHGFTFLVPSDPETEDTDMVRIIARWLGYEMEWVKHLTPYAQGLASVFNISLGIVSWWTSKESERYNRLIQLRVFAFCLNILHAYITGPIIYQNDDLPLLAPGRIIGLFRLSYLTPGLMAAGVTEVIVEKEQETAAEQDEGNNALTSGSGPGGGGGSTSGNKSLKEGSPGSSGSGNKSEQRISPALTIPLPDKNK